MKEIKYLFISALAMLLISCSSSQEVLSSWVNKEALSGKKYKRVFVMVLSQNQSSKTIVENDLASSLNALGYESVKSINALAGLFRENTQPSKEDIFAKIKESNCDLILTTSLLDSKTETRYVPGTITYYAPYPRYGYYAGFRNYYGYYAPTVYSPGYYTNDKTYYLEANLFDVESEKILWSVQSSVYNPSSLKEFSSTYCKLLVYQATDDGLLQ